MTVLRQYCDSTVSDQLEVMSFAANIIISKENKQQVVSFAPIFLISGIRYAAYSMSCEVSIRYAASSKTKYQHGPTPHNTSIFLFLLFLILSILPQLGDTAPRF